MIAFAVFVAYLALGGGNERNFEAVPIEPKEPLPLRRLPFKKTSCECGVRNNVRQKRIAGGRNTREGEFPWVAEIQNPVNNEHLCGASIATPYHVLTVAHCVVNSKTRIKSEIKNVVVYVGKYNIKSDARHGMTRRHIVRETHIPDDWWGFVESGNIYVGDLAVLVLRDKIYFSNFVQPICLTSKVLPDDVINEVEAFGWGESESSDRQSSFLSTKLSVVFRKSKSRDRVIHASSEWSSLCAGDSGGPLAAIDPQTNRYTLIGIPFAIEYGLCMADIISYSTNVTHYYNYIQRIIRHNMPDYVQLCEKLD